jgi:hypothetical protein
VAIPVAGQPIDAADPQTPVDKRKRNIPSKPMHRPAAGIRMHGRVNMDFIFLNIMPPKELPFAAKMIPIAIIILSGESPKNLDEYMRQVFRQIYCQLFFPRPDK